MAYYDNMPSGFKDSDGKPVPMGDWLPTYFLFFTGPAREGKRKQWLIVGDSPEVTIRGKAFTLEPVTCPVKDLVGLESPCAAHKLRKVIIVGD